MFRRILIANRGEVAARVLRTCKGMGIEVVAVTSSVDRDLAWLRGADKVICIGGPKAYLDEDAMLDTAVAEGASAIHPGWGFLSERPSFAARCEAVGIRFLGPSSALLRRMGDKVEARRTMAALGVEVIPGTGLLGGVAEAREAASGIGYPVLLKAVSGGGGRGMRRVDAPGGMEAAWNEASGEARGSFGDDRLYMEKLIERGRHIEFQVLGDRRGTIWQLGERECSLQRRHQKLVEESPSCAVDDALRARVGERLTEALSALGYVGAGTVEMLRTQEGQLYFMEMNTRLQVEHPVTELVCGLDLVEWQLRVAAGQTLPPVPPKPSGHAIEVRINAEDPANGFAPSPGTLTKWELPRGDGIRVDTHLEPGDRVSPDYDSLLCKLIAHGADRAQALARIESALNGLVVEGVSTTRTLHQHILADPGFRAGEYDTGSVEDRIVAEVT
jgi:acetyl-CoA carboxylase biotin carboxylase subunit